MAAKKAIKRKHTIKKKKVQKTRTFRRAKTHKNESKKKSKQELVKNLIRMTNIPQASSCFRNHNKKN